jgi:predicted nucleotidyltransferase component of viral defense system
VHVRLINHAKALSVDPNLMLVRYATERLLYRLSRSPYAEQFVLKGGLLMLVWLGEAIRPTRDADLLGFGMLDAETLARIFLELCAVAVEPDGLGFDAASVRVAAIRPEDAYGGQRVTLTAHLRSARLRVQMDIGVGDDVTPPAEWLEYPSLLNLPRPRLRAYRPETTIAEKVHAMVVLGSKNSRMRDFFDVYALASHKTFRGDLLAQALRATFERRRTALPGETPIALTQAFAEIDGKRAQWTGFLRRNRLSAVPELVDVLREIARFVQPVLVAATRNETFAADWQPGGPWKASA